jgi:group I intron endonuclease
MERRSLASPTKFSLEILEYCEKVKAVILSKEQFYLDFLKPKYNILKVAGSSLGYKHDDEAKKKISAATKNPAPPATEETRAKMSPCGRSSCI